MSKGEEILESGNREYLDTKIDENVKIAFSSKYMMEALKSFSTETVDIHFGLHKLFYIF